MRITFRSYGYIVLNERDFDIFNFLESTTPKTATELSRLFWKDKSKRSHVGQKRILRLVSCGLLERCDPTFLYLADFGRKVLGQQRNKQSAAGLKSNQAGTVEIRTKAGTERRHLPGEYQI